MEDDADDYREVQVGAGFGGVALKKTLADRIREYVYIQYVAPEREKWASMITIRTGDVHAEMELNNRLPAVCGALTTNKFQEQYGVRLVNHTGPNQGANVLLTFEL